MATEEIAAFNRQMIERVNRGDLNGAFQFFAPGFTFHNPNRPEVHSRDEYQRLWTNFRTAFEDAHIEIEDMVVEGNMNEGKVVTRYTVSGTARGEWRGVQPSGQKLAYHGMTIARVAGGLFVETWEINDVVGILQQLGAVSWVTS